MPQAYLEQRVKELKRELRKIPKVNRTEVALVYLYALDRGLSENWNRSISRPEYLLFDENPSLVEKYRAFFEAGKYDANQFGVLEFDYAARVLHDAALSSLNKRWWQFWKR